MKTLTREDLEGLTVAELQRLLQRVERVIERRQVHKPAQIIRGLKQAARNRGRMH